jgi:hypothetical protein
MMRAGERRELPMIARNINKSYKPDMTMQDIVTVGNSKWSGISDASLEKHASSGDTVLFVARNRMVAAATVTRAVRDDEGYIHFDLEPATELSARVAGVRFPDPWLRGQSRSVRYIDQEAIDAAVAEATTAEGDPASSEVALDGFRLIVDAAGAATLVVPAGRDVTVSARRSR